MADERDVRTTASQAPEVGLRRGAPGGVTTLQPQAGLALHELLRLQPPRGDTPPHTMSPRAGGGLRAGEREEGWMELQDGGENSFAAIAGGVGSFRHSQVALQGADSWRVVNEDSTMQGGPQAVGGAHSALPSRRGTSPNEELLSGSFAMHQPISRGGCQSAAPTAASPACCAAAGDQRAAFSTTAAMARDGQVLSNAPQHADHASAGMHDAHDNCVLPHEPLAAAQGSSGYLPALVAALPPIPHSLMVSAPLLHVGSSSPVAAAAATALNRSNTEPRDVEDQWSTHSTVVGFPDSGPLTVAQLHVRRGMMGPSWGGERDWCRLGWTHVYGLWRRCACKRWVSGAVGEWAAHAQRWWGRWGDAWWRGWGAPGAV
jgi:hypothetical protein